MKSGTGNRTVVALGLLMALSALTPTVAMSDNAKTLIIKLSNGQVAYAHYWQFTPCNAKSKIVGWLPCPSASRNISRRLDLPKTGCAPCAGARCNDFVYQSAYVGPACQTLININFCSNPNGVGLAPTAAGDAGAEDSLQVDAVLVGPNMVLSNFAGQMKHDSGIEGAKRITKSTAIYAVYPDSFAYNADPNLTGAGALFYGKVVFEQAKVLRISGFGATPKFGPNDFVLTTNPDGSGSNIVKAAPSLSKSVAAPSTAVVILSDETIIGNGESPVPAAPPLGIAFLSLLLLGSGLFVMRGRLRETVA